MRLQHIAMALGPIWLGGCGSSWNIGDDLSGFEREWFYLDSDADGWGDPGTAPQELAQADIAGGYTSRNDRDCDPDDEQITGRIGGLCPDGISGGGDYAGVSYPGASEYATTHGAGAPTTRSVLASGDCAMWGAPIDAGEIVAAPGQLATLQAAGELDPLLPVVQGDAVYAAWVGIVWQYEDTVAVTADSDASTVDAAVAEIEAGDWAWEDGSDANSIRQSFAWCTGAPPSPFDLFPYTSVNPNDPKQLVVIKEDLPTRRLALVWQDSATEWCLGVPTDAVSDAPGLEWSAEAYTTDTAHVLCERTWPDPALYTSKPTSDAPAE